MNCATSLVYFWSVFIMVASQTTDEEDAKGMSKMIVEQLRMLNANRQMKKSFMCMSEALEFSAEIQSKQRTVLTRINCEVAELHKRMVYVSDSYLSALAKVKQITDSNRELSSQLADTNRTVNQLTDSRVLLTRQLADKNRKVKLLTDSTGRLKRQLADKNKQVDQFKDSITRLGSQVSAHNIEVGELTNINKNLETQLSNQNTKMDQLKDSNLKLKSQLSDHKTKVDKLTDTNEELKGQLSNKESEILALQEKLAEISQENLLNVLNMQVMKSSLDEYQRRKQQLEQQVKQLSNKVNAQAKCLAMDKPPSHLQQIVDKVKAFTSSNDWRTLKIDLDGLLDDNSEVHTQLQDTVSVWDVGYKGHTQLATLLLCAGLPLDMGDSSGDTMIHGAAWSGRLQLVDLLLDSGADIDMVNSKGETPLDIARKFNHLDVVERLMQAGPGTTSKDKSSKRALD